MAYDVGRAQGEIVINYKGDGVKDAAKDLEGLQKSTRNVGPAVDKLGDGMTKAGLAIGAGFGLAIKSAVDFEARMSAVGAVSGASADEMDQLTKKALQLGKDTKFSATGAAEAIEELVKAGVSVPEVMNGAADATVALAAAGEIDLPQAATIAANAMNSFGLSAQQLPKVADAIAGAANASAIDVGQFGQSLSQVGAVANLAGLSFEDTATAIALLGNAGIKGSDAGTSLKTMLQNLQPQTKAQIALFKELGIVTEDGSNRFYDAQGNLKSFDQVAQILNESLAGMTQQQKQMALETMFGSDAIRAAAIIADEGAAGFNNMSTAMGKVSAADVAAARMDNFKGSLEEFLGTLETVGITVGQIFIPVLRDIVDGIGSVLDKFLELPAGVQQTITYIAAAAGAFLLFGGILIKVIRGFQAFGAVLGPIFAVIGGALTRFIGPFVSGLTSSAAAASAFSGIMGTLGGVVRTALMSLLGPVGIVIGIITALAGAAIYAYNNFEPFRNLVDQIAATIKGGFLQALEGARQALDAVVQGFRGVTGATGALGFFQQLGAALRDVWTAFQTLGQAIYDAWISIQPQLQASGSQLSEAFAKLGVALQPLADAIVNQVLPALQQFAQFMAPIIIAVGNFALQLAGGVILALIQFAALIIGTVLPAIIQFAAFLIGGLIQAITAVILFFTNLITTILNFVTMLTTTVIAGVTAFIAAFQAAWNGLVTFFTTLWTAITTIFTTALTGIQTFFTSVWNGLVAIVTTVMTAIQTAINVALGFIGAVWSAFWNGPFGQTIQNVMGLVGDIVNLAMALIQFVIGSALVAIQAVWTSVWNAVKAIVTTVLNAIKSVVTTVFNAIKSFITTVVNAIRSVVTTVWNAIRSATQSVFNAIRSVIQSVMNAIRSIVTSVVNAIRSTVTNVWNAIRSVTSSVWNAIRSLISSVLNGIRSTVQSVLNGIKSFISSTWNSMNSSTNGAFNRFVSTIRGAINNAMNIVNGIRGRVMSAVSGAGSWLINAGRNVIQGFLNGINSMIGAVRSKLAELTNMIPKVKGPPKKDKILLEDNGKLIMQGLINGIVSQVGNLQDELQGITTTIPALVDTTPAPIVFPRDTRAPDVTVESNAPADLRPVIQQTNHIYNPVARDESLETNDELQLAAAFVGV